MIGMGCGYGISTRTSMTTGIFILTHTHPNQHRTTTGYAQQQTDITVWLEICGVSLIHFNSFFSFLFSRESGFLLHVLVFLLIIFVSLEKRILDHRHHHRHHHRLYKLTGFLLIPLILDFFFYMLF